MTCDNTNFPSRKIIENAGGEFEGLSQKEKGVPAKRLYWISIGEPSPREGPQRIVIIGASGSGKTTLGRFLSSKWNLPFCDLDDLAWLPEWTQRNRNEERVDVEKVVVQEKWIIVGNYSRHRDIIWYNADRIVWLDLPLFTCVCRGLCRSILNIWYHRPLCNGNYESLGRLLCWDTRSILYWILATHKKKRSCYTKLLENEKDQKLPECYHLRSCREVRGFMDAVERAPLEEMGV